MGRPVNARGARKEPGPEAEEVAARRRRAAEEPLDVRLRSREPVVDLDVRNPIHRTSYRVLFPEYPHRDSAICTCTDFARRGLGTCKHLEAGWSWLQGLPRLPEVAPPPAPTRPPGEVWKEIDGRLERLVRSPPQQIRAVEQAGAVLFERKGGPEPGPREGEERVGSGRASRPPPRSTSRGRP